MKTKPRMLAPSDKTEGKLQAEAWTAWLDSKDGANCAGDAADGRYLENRLWAAFMAGYEAARINRARASKQRCVGNLND